jgi:hypothetical protein
MRSNVALRTVFTFLSSFAIFLVFTPIVASADCNDLVYQKPYLLSNGDQSLVAPIYNLGYSDALD